MRKEEFLESINQNFKSIYSNFLSVFGIEIEEFKDLILNINLAFVYNKQLNEKDFSLDIFSVENLSELKHTLIEVGLTEEEIKKTIIKSPIMLLYSNDLSGIYFLYKNKKYYGYIVLDKEEFYTYLINDNLPNNLISNNYITERMLRYYNVQECSTQQFDALESEFKLKNYYLKRKHNRNKM